MQSENTEAMENRECPLCGGHMEKRKSSKWIGKHYCPKCDLTQYDRTAIKDSWLAAGQEPEVSRKEKMYEGKATV